MANERVSWLVIERGWAVVTSDGESAGRIDELVGDSGMDIFSGVTVRTGVVGTPRFVPAEHVRAIVEGRVELDLTKREVDELDEYREPPEQAEIRPP